MKIAQLIIISFIFVGCSKNEFDIIISNGIIVDGSGQGSYQADIGIVDDRIEKIGDLSESKSVHIINAENLIVSPGFIDSHTHAIRGIFDVPTAESSLLQGVTTLTEGNDGTSPFPIKSSNIN
jgi:N-acyl-D-amino-acid deacylase